MRIFGIIFSIAVACLLFAAVYLYNLISQGHFALEQAARYNIVWSINQSLVELTHFEQKLAEAAILGHDADLAELEVRYQILLGRADILRQGSSADFIRQNSEYLEILEDFENRLIAAEPVLARFGEPGSIAELNRILAPWIRDSQGWHPPQDSSATSSIRSIRCGSGASIFYIRALRSG